MHETCESKNTPNHLILVNNYFYWWEFASRVVALFNLFSHFTLAFFVEDELWADLFVLEQTDYDFHGSVAGKTGPQ